MRSLMFPLTLLVVTSLGTALPATGQVPAIDVSSITGHRVAGPTLHIDPSAVPYAVRADALLREVAHLHRADAENGTEGTAQLMRTIGLDPESPAARELIDLAVELDNDHPVVTEEALRQAKAGNGLDLDRPGGWLDQRYAKAGRTLGLWLRARAAKGWAIEPLVDRLLNSGHLRVTLFTDQDPAEIQAKVERQSRLFHHHLSAELGHLPRRFTLWKRSL